MAENVGLDVIFPAIKTDVRDDDVSRRSAGYHPSLWGDFFLTHSSNFLENDRDTLKQHEELKQEVKAVLVDETIDVSRKLELIDATCRLGVGYHFGTEIAAQLEKLHDAPRHLHLDTNTISIWFQLLRGHGFTVSPDLFINLKKTNKELEEADITTLLSLYGATQLRIEGETVLEEVLQFTRKKLEALLPQLRSPLKEYIEDSLKLPFHKGMQRLEARQYIPLYESKATREDFLLQFAKIDFNLLQALHQVELKEISRWWKQLDFSSKLPYARDRLVECYFWILGVHFEPQFSLSRKFLTKVICLASVIDDTYDVYGTFEEVQMFTNAVDRWEIEAASHLPIYMQTLYLGLLDVFDEYRENLIDVGGRDYCFQYAKEAMKGLIRAYHKEAVFFHSRYVPNFEEYMENSILSSGYPMLMAEVLIGMSQELATKESLDWALSVPTIIKASAAIARLVDDFRTYKSEEERGDAPSGVRCYMRQFGVSEEEACSKIEEMVDQAWKTINEEIQCRNHLPLQMLTPALNFARMMEVLYQDVDGYTNSGGKTKDRIASLLVHPVHV